MFSTRAVVRTALIALSFSTVFLQLSSQPTYALELPFFGKVTFGNNSNNTNKTTLRLDVLFGYRSSPQFYTAGEDTVEIRALVVNNENSAQTGRYETKIYRVSSVWDSRNTGVTYDQRFDFVNAEPDDEIYTFGEGTLRELFLDSRDCNIREDEFCHQSSNPEDSDYPYGGVTIDTKPVFVTIGDEITLAGNERVNIVAQWEPTQCGYYQIVVQPFGYQEVLNNDNTARDAFIRVKGCEEGEILDYGAVAVRGRSPETGVGDALGDFVDMEHLPATSDGMFWYFLPVFGLILGGIMVHRGMKGAI